jgi:endonuclease/exonuclease/phosphatase family metal-dependent hydrolase
MKKLLLLIAAAVIMLTYSDFRYAGVPALMEKKPVYEEAEQYSAELLPPIKVMTYNIHRGINKEKKLDLDGIVETIRSSGAEVVALQEVERFSVRTRFQDQIGYIADKLSMGYVFGKSLNILNGEYGNAILSIYPIEEYEVKELPCEGEQRTLLKARLNVNGGRLSLYNTHLGLKQSERELQLEEIMEYVSADKDFILAGDFNTTVDKLFAISEEYYDSAVRAGDSNSITFEGEGLNERIDYIFTSKSFETIEYEVTVSQASDHYPVVSVVELKPMD